MAVKSRPMIEVYEVVPGRGRDPKQGVIELLPPEPIPQVGDVLLLSRRMTGAEADAAVFFDEFVPYKVVEREWMYHRLEKFAPSTECVGPVGLG